MTPVSQASGLQIASELKQTWEKRFSPSIQQVFLYGSVARGQAQEDSDIDIAIVCTPFARSKIREAREFYASAPSMDARVSLIVVHPDELHQKTSVIPSALRAEGIAV